jgi:hypothetical protein
MQLVPPVGPGDLYLDDPLAPLIMRTSFASGYAAAPKRTNAQRAADALATGAATSELQVALQRAAVRKARELGVVPGQGAIIQLGSFAHPENAARVARDFARFGQVERRESETNGRFLTTLRVTVDPALTSDAVMAAAVEAGLSGAFLVAE